MHSRPFRQKRICLAAVVAAAFFTAFPARAEDLLQVFDAARSQDAALRAAQRRRDAAQPRAAQAQALFLPNISAQGAYTRSQYDPPAGDDVPDGTHLRGTTNSVALNLRQTLFNRQSTADVKRANLEEELAQIEYESTTQEFVVRVAQAYFDVLSAQEVLEAARQSKESILGQLTSAQLQYNAGTGIITDVRDAQARYDLAVAQEQLAANELHVNTLALARQTGRRDMKPNPLVQPVKLPASVLDSVDSWVDSSVVHPAVRLAQLNLDVARVNTDRTQAGRLPTLDVVAALSSSHQSGTNPELGVLGTTRKGSLGVELNVPIFSGNAIDNRIREAVILQAKAEDDLEAAKRTVAESTERAFFQLQSSHAQVNALETANLSSIQSLDATQRGYKAGVRLSLDVLNAQAQLYGTQRDLAKSRYAVLVDLLKLRLAAGRLSADDLQEINKSVAP